MDPDSGQPNQCGSITLKISSAGNEANLDDLHVGAEEEEVGGGGNSVVVDVVAPGPTLPHLRALQAVCFHHLNTHRRKIATLGQCSREVSRKRYFKV
jgi:hypothetical protein